MTLEKVYEGAIYTYKDHDYELKTKCMMKHPDTGKWLDAVLYVGHGDIWIREIEDFKKKFVFKKGAVLSIASNIAEGNHRETSKDRSHFYTMALSSAAELISHLTISLELNGINNLDFDDFTKYKSRITEIMKMIYSLRKTEKERPEALKLAKRAP